MPVSFKTSAGADPGEELLRLFSDVIPSSDDMLRAANAQIFRIKDRTASGVDVNGNTFNSYSPQYQKTRVKKGLPVSPVDLRSTGAMLDSLQAQVLSKNSFAIELTQAQEYAQSVNSKRLFFDTSLPELEKMADDLSLK